MSQFQLTKFGLVANILFKQILLTIILENFRLDHRHFKFLRVAFVQYCCERLEADLLIHCLALLLLKFYALQRYRLLAKNLHRATRDLRVVGKKDVFDRVILPEKL